VKTLVLASSQALDSLSFAREYEALVPRIRGFLFRYGFKDDLDDLVQEVFEKAWRKRRSFQQGSKFSTWVMRIAVNVAIDHQRKKALWSKFLRRYEPSCKAEAKASDGSTEEALEIAFSRLPKKVKEVAILALVEGYKYTEVSEITGIPLGSVKVLAVEARQMLMKYLDEMGVSYES